MKKLLILAIVFVLTACGSKEQQIRVDGQPGTPGQDGISMGIDVSSTAPSCLAGGTTLKTFLDANRNSEFDLDETVKGVSVVCNGVNGSNGSNGIDGTSVTISTANATQCPTGGVIMQAGLITAPICNGANGQMGPQGLQGISGLQGIPGAIGPQGVAGQTGKSAYQIWLDLGNTGSESQFIYSLTGPQGQSGTNGSNGLSAYQIWLNLGNTGTQTQFLASLVGPAGSTGSVGAVGPQGPQGTSGGVGNITPVQLCPGDTATFKEYGFIVGSDLYAVYFDKNQPVAFLAKLSPGNYVTTNGSSCYFNYANNGSAITLRNSNNSNLVTTVNIGSSSGPCNAGNGNGNGNGCNNNGNGN